MPLVSIALSTYDRPQYIKELTIPCLLSQSFKDWECFIAGDYCSDDVAEEITKSISDSRIKFFNCERPWYRDKPADIGSGVWNIAGVDALNKALDKCSGKYLFRLDDDDLWKPNHIQNYLEIFESTGTQAINSRAEHHQYNSYLGQFGHAFNPDMMLAGQNHMFHSTVAWDASKIGFRHYSNDPILPADLQQWISFAKDGISFEFSDKITVTYLQRCSVDYSKRFL